VSLTTTCPEEALPALVAVNVNLSVDPMVGVAEATLFVREMLAYCGFKVTLFDTPLVESVEFGVACVKLAVFVTAEVVATVTMMVSVCELPDVRSGIVQETVPESWLTAPVEAIADT
jgi:hypothetical protein